METNTEQPAQADSANSAEDRFAEKMNRMFGGDPQPSVEGDDDPTDDAEASGDVAEEQPLEESSAALEEVEIEGKTYQVPSEIKSALMRQQDYTRKTQEVAEQRKLVQLQQQAAQMEQMFREQAAPEFEALAKLEAQIAQFKNVDWNSLDMETMVRYRHSLDVVKEQREEAKQALERRQREFQNTLTQKQQEMLQQGQEWLRRNLPKWDADEARAIAQYGQEQGFTDFELNNLSDPRTVRMFWKARQYDLLQQQKGTIAQKAAKAPPVLKPGVSDPAQSQRMQQLNFRKGVKSAKSDSDRVALLAQKFARFK